MPGFSGRWIEDGSEQCGLILASGLSGSIRCRCAIAVLYAIATGLITALNMGDNTMGMLITRALAEMSRFAARMGANPLTFLGLSGVGDLVTTCTSPLSRNFRIGRMLGEGLSLESAVAQIGEVAEGVNTIRIVKQKAQQLQIRMHILEGLHALLFEGFDLPTVLKQLMNAPQMEDVELIYRPKGNSNLTA